MQDQRLNRYFDSLRYHFGLHIQAASQYTGRFTITRET
jgi:hypothetical protein